MMTSEGEDDGCLKKWKNKRFPLGGREHDMVGVAISHEQALPLVRPEESELLPITLVGEDGWEAWATSRGCLWSGRSRNGALSSGAGGRQCSHLVFPPSPSIPPRTHITYVAEKEQRHQHKNLLQSLHYKIPWETSAAVHASQRTQRLRPQQEPVGKHSNCQGGLRENTPAWGDLPCAYGGPGTLHVHLT